MANIARVFRQYAERGFKPQFLSRFRIRVTDPVTGHFYHVTSGGRAVVGKELREELEQTTDLTKLPGEEEIARWLDDGGKPAPVDEEDTPEPRIFKFNGPDPVL